MNKNSVKTKPKTLKMLADNEVPQALASAISICKDNDVDISSIIKHKSEEVN